MEEERRRRDLLAMRVFYGEKGREE